MWIFIAIGIICGFVIGIFVGKHIAKVDGLFIIDDSDNETTRWILDVKTDPKNIPTKKEIRLKVRKMEEEGV